MSESDSFIDEVTEAIRRDRLFALMRRYGWIAVLAVLVLVGGAGWNEWRKAQARQRAEALGDSVLAALEQGDRAARAAALDGIEAPNGESRAMIDLLAAAEESEAAPAAAAERLLALAGRNDVAAVYRQIATLKAVTVPGAGLPPEVRRSRLDGLALAGGLVGLLAEEQIALIEIETGATEAALDRLRRVAVDAGATPGLRRRVSQVIVALGGELPEMPQTVQE